MPSCIVRAPPGPPCSCEPPFMAYHLCRTIIDYVGFKLEPPTRPGSVSSGGGACEGPQVREVSHAG